MARDYKNYNQLSVGHIKRLVISYMNELDTIEAHRRKVSRVLNIPLEELRKKVDTISDTDEPEGETEENECETEENESETEENV